MKASDFFNQQEQQEIKEAILAAEKDTSGEIRVHLEKNCKCDAFEHAIKVFEELGMTKTEQRNAVLFFFLIEKKAFVILGDKGIDAVVPAHFWDTTKDMMLEYFKRGNYKDGLVKGILSAGKQLKEHFPYQKSDSNELPDDISFGG